MSRLRSIAISCLLVSSANLCGCVERRITVTTDPEGALAYLNNQEIGRTPVTRDFTWYGDYDIQIRKEGYQTLSTHEQVIAPLWQWVPLDFLAEVWPGRLHDDRTLAYQLAPADTDQPADAGQMLDHASVLHSQLRSSENTRTRTTQPTTSPTTTSPTLPSSK